MTGVIAGLLGSIDSVLGVRDAIGAVKEPVFFVTRTWFSDAGLTTPAAQVGGFAKDTEVQMLPSPGIKDFSQNIRLREGGAVKAGDIILTSVSRNKFGESDLDGSSSAANVEQFYRVGAKLYQVINVTEGYVTWDVQLRELTNQGRYV